MIDPEGNQLGVVSIEEAMKAAAGFGLDLVEVSPNAAPPVCKIMDYGRYKYEQTKKKQEAKRKQSTFQVKEIKFRRDYFIFHRVIELSSSDDIIIGNFRMRQVKIQNGN